MNDAIEVVGLTKRYGSVAAVDDLSFSVPSGSVFAFLGTNGAGKSTTIGCVTTTVPFDRGTVLVAGRDIVRDPGAVRRRIGVVFQDSLMDAGLTVRENLLTRARLYGMATPRITTRIGELSDLIGIAAFLDRRCGRLSGGQRRRVDIARALLHEPSLLFLDEPTAGLDPASRAAVWQTLHGLRERRGLTVFLTTHYMEETEHADRVCIIEAGRVIADGTPAGLRAEHARGILTITTRARPELEAMLTRVDVEAVWAENVATVAVDDGDVARMILCACGDAVADFEFRHGRMDDVFLALTGRDATEPRR